MFTPPMLEMVAKTIEEDWQRKAERATLKREQNSFRLRLTLLNGVGLIILVLTQLL